MSGPFVPSVGGTLSADIAVPEHDREVRFYSRVLGTGERPLWREDLMNSLGMPIIGLGARSADHDRLPLQWMPHVQVADVAASAEHALDLGGDELMHATDEDGNSQWAVLLDPNGAAFGIIPVVDTDAIPPTDGDAERTGRISGLDLTVPDAPTARDFYREVIGWSVRDVETKEAGRQYTDYEMLAEDGSPAARLRQARGAGSDLPPVWMIHLPVGDLAESLRRVQEEGGRVIEATRGDDGEYTHAAVQDPVGASFALVPE